MARKKVQIDDPTDAAAATHRAADLPRTLRGGTPKMRSKGVTYLPRWDKEPEEAWVSRRDNSFLFDAYTQAVDSHAGRLFADPIKLDEDVPDEIQEWWENIDLGGQHGDIFSAHAFCDSLDPGVGFILTDYPTTDGRRVPPEQERREGRRPFCTYIPSEDVLGWRTERVSGSEVLTMLRVREVTEEPAEGGDWGDVPTRRVRVYYLDSKGEGFARFELYKENEKGDGYDLETEGVMQNATRIPVRPFYARRHGFFQGRPWMEAMAWKNLEHWQSASDQRAGLHFARAAVFKATGMQEEDLKIIGFGHGTVLFSSRPDANIDYLQYGASGLTIGERDLRQIEEQLSVLGLEPLLHKPGDPTATAKAINESRANSRLRQAGRSWKDTIEGVLADMAMWARLPSSGTVMMNDDFGLTLGDSRELETLLKARAAREISRETMWAEFRRRNVLVSDFDVEEETRRLADEDAVLARLMEGDDADLAD